MTKTDPVGSRQQIGATYSIEGRGLCWAVLDAGNLVCLVRGRNLAFAIAMKQQRQHDDRAKVIKATVPITD